MKAKFTDGECMLLGWWWSQSMRPGAYSRESVSLLKIESEPEHDGFRDMTPRPANAQPMTEAE